MTAETDKEFVERISREVYPGFDGWRTVSMMDHSLDRLFAFALRGAETQWRPIEEAPKEAGKFYLGWNGHWRGVIQYFVPAYLDDPEWVDETTEFIEPPPTHFIPLTALGEPTPQPIEKVKG